VRARVATFERAGWVDVATIALAAVLAVVADLLGAQLSNGTWAILISLAGIGRYGLIRLNGPRKTA